MPMDILRVSKMKPDQELLWDKLS